MPLLSGAMGFRRYRVINAPSSLDRDTLLESLSKHGFRKPPSAATGGETTGWVSLHNLCVTDFPYDECWFNQYFVFSLRVDNKRLPAQLLRAMVELRVRDWLAESGREKIPGGLKREMKEQLELELFPKQLPTVAAHNVAWDTSSHVLRFFNTSERVNEMFRILFFRTFGFETRPVGSVELVSAHRNAGKWMPTLDRLGHCDYRPEVN